MKFLLLNLKAGTRLLFFRRTGPSDFHFSPDQWVFLALLQVGYLCAADYLHIFPDGQLNIFAFSDVGLLLLSMMLAGYLVSRLWHDGRLLLAVPVLALSIALPFSLIAELTRWLWGSQVDELEWPAWLLAGWLAAAMLHGFYSLAGRRAVRASLGVVAAAIVLLPQLWFIGISSFWETPPFSAMEEDLLPPPIDGEDVMYKQPALLSEAFAGLQDQRKGIADMYFVGFAGDASQDVFAKEAAYAHSLLYERYGSKGRSLLLVNSSSTVDSLPIASITNLKLALRRVGDFIDDEEDVLMLFLTSHGSQDFELAVNFAPMPLNSLTPAALKRYLDEAGIKWRLIIVSACYSGGYVSALQNPYTIVMTAASPDRTSFGCDTDRDFTYFGEAYFRDQLARGVPLLQSFHNAAAQIEKREQQEGLTPSQPQLYVGEEIAARLPMWETSWQQRNCGADAAAC